MTQEASIKILESALQSVKEKRCRVEVIEEEWDYDERDNSKRIVKSTINLLSIGPIPELDR